MSVEFSRADSYIIVYSFQHFNRNSQGRQGAMTLFHVVIDVFIYVWKSLICIPTKWRKQGKNCLVHDFRNWDVRPCWVNLHCTSCSIRSVFTISWECLLLWRALRSMTSILYSSTKDHANCSFSYVMQRQIVYLHNLKCTLCLIHVLSGFKKQTCLIIWWAKSKIRGKETVFCPVLWACLNYISCQHAPKRPNCSSEGQASKNS